MTKGTEKPCAGKLSRWSGGKKKGAFIPKSSISPQTSQIAASKTGKVSVFYTHLSSPLQWAEKVDHPTFLDANRLSLLNALNCGV